MADKPLHEMSREEFFNDPARVRATIPHEHHVKYKYTSPSGAGPFTGSHAYPHPVAKGESIQGVFGRAVATSKSKAVPKKDVDLYEHGKKVHREAVESAHAAGKYIPSHVLADYPHLNSQHSEFDPEEIVSRGPLGNIKRSNV